MYGPAPKLMWDVKVRTHRIIIICRRPKILDGSFSGSSALPQVYEARLTYFRLYGTSTYSISGARSWQPTATCGAERIDRPPLLLLHFPARISLVRPSTSRRQSISLEESIDRLNVQSDAFVPTTIDSSLQ